MTIRGRLISLVALAAAATALCAAQALPTPPLRVIWLSGNPVMARVGTDGTARGPAIDLAQAIAAKLHRPLQVEAVAGTDALLKRLRDGGADLAFVAYDPSRAAGLRFTPPYLLSANTFAVPAGSPIADGSQVDRPGVRIGAMLTDSGGLFLRRTVKNATLVPIASVDAGLDQLKAKQFDVLGGAAQRLIDRRGEGGFTILRGSFYQVPQSIAVRAEDSELLALATTMIKQARETGALAASIARAKLEGASVPSAAEMSAPH